MPANPRQKTFQVEVEGDPVFLWNAHDNRLERVGFFATRWIDAESADEAGRLACEVVLKELMRKKPRNPADQPIKVALAKITVLSETERRAKRPLEAEFSFFPHEIH